MNLTTLIHRRMLALIALGTLLASALAIAPAGPVGAATPTCASADSDPDGDGWGWENNQSCKVATESNPTTNAGTAECVDTDGDGWGWNGTESCEMPDTSAPDTTSSDGTPVCKSKNSVSDDGWGWEDGRSCRAVQLPHSMKVTSTVWGSGYLYNHVVFTNPNDFDELAGFKIYRDGVLWKTIGCNGRCEAGQQLSFNDVAPGNTLLYGVEAIVAGGGLDYLPRRDVFAPVDTAPSTAKAFPQDPVHPANTATGKAQREYNDARTDFYDAAAERNDAYDEYYDAQKDVEIVSSGTSTSSSNSVTVKVEASGTVTVIPSGTIGGSVSGQVAEENGTSLVAVPRDGSEVTLDRYKDAKAELARKDAALAEAAEEADAAFDEYRSCSRGDDCSFSDDPVVTPPPPPGGGADDPPIHTPVTPPLGPDRPEGECHGRPHC